MRKPDLLITVESTEAALEAVAAIGPVCADVLTQHGVTPHVMPTQSKMGFLVTELAVYLSRDRT